MGSRRAAWVCCTLAIACLAPAAAVRAAPEDCEPVVKPGCYNAEIDLAQSTVEESFPGLPAKVHAGEVFRVMVVVKNTGLLVWKRAFCETTTLFRVGAHWKGPIEVFDVEDPGKGYQPMRGQIPFQMGPGDSAKVLAFLQAPSVPGKYTVRFDMVHEGVTWFETQGVKTVERPIQVDPAPQSGDVRKPIPWEPVITPGNEPPFKQHRIYIQRTPPCPVTVDFGDGSPPVTLGPNQAYVETNFSQVGNFLVRAKAAGSGSGSCADATDSGSTGVEVSNDTCPFVPLLYVCDPANWSIDCCAVFPELCANVFAALDTLLNPPHIAGLDSLGVLHPGDFVLLKGEHFGASPGSSGKVALLMEDFKGNDQEVAMETVTWHADKILARVPSDLSGFIDQAGNLRVTRSDGKTSNAFSVLLVPVQAFDVVPPGLVTESCDNAVHCNHCNDAVDCSDPVAGPPFLFPVDTSIVGEHFSEPIFFCLFGGGSGTDRYTVHLKNGWHFSAIGPSPGGGNWSFGSVPIGASDFEVTVKWSVGSCESVRYRSSIVIEGPRGVPFQ